MSLRGFVWLPVLLTFAIVMGLSGAAYWYKHMQLPSEGVSQEGWVIGTRGHWMLAQTATADMGTPLLFTSESLCSYPSSATKDSCDGSKVMWGYGDRALVHGTMQNNTLEVSRMEITSSESPSQSGIKTYSDTALAFSFGYPSDWKIRVIGKDAPTADDRQRVLYIESVAYDGTLAQYFAKNDNATDQFGESGTTIISSKNLILNGNPAVERKEESNSAGFDLWCTYFKWSNSTPVVSLCISGRDGEITQNVISQYEGVMASLKKSQSNSPQTISVPGMSKYIDIDFGFSFWYPNDYDMSAETANSDAYDGVTIEKIFTIASRSIPELEVSIEEVFSPAASLTINAESGCPGGHCSPTLRYYFDSSAHAWMQEYPLGYSSDGGVQPVAAGTVVPADVSHNTMGGLHMLTAGFRGTSIIVPLSAHNFVVVSWSYTMTPASLGQLLAKTIVATDPSVATPLSASEQVKIIQAEKDAYANQ